MGSFLITYNLIYDVSEMQAYRAYADDDFSEVISLHKILDSNKDVHSLTMNNSKVNTKAEAIEQFHEDFITVQRQKGIYGYRVNVLNVVDLN